MGLPVVTVASGGLPVSDQTAGGRGMAVTEATYGIAVTKVTGGGGIGVVYVSATGGSVVTSATFDGATANGAVVSGGGLTVTHTTTTNQAGARSTALKSSGKYYFEAVLQVSHTPNNCVGVLLSSGTFVDMGASLNCTEVILTASTPVISNGANSGNLLGAAAVGDLYCFSIDMDARLAWIRKGAAGNWNNNGAANPSTGTNGVVIAAGSFAPAVRFTTGGATDTLTANFGASSFSGAVPSGFTAGWPA